MAPAQKPKRPFRDGTRQRFVPVTSIPYAAGQAATPIYLPKTGFVNALILTLTGTMTLSNTGTLTDDGAYALFNRIKFGLNQGSQNLFDTTGYGAYLVQRWLRQGNDPTKAGSGDTTPNADIYAAPVASGANVWQLSLRIPIALNDGRDFDIGIINVQSPQVQALLQIQWGNPLDAVSLATGFVGTLTVGYEAYDVPDQTLYDNPPVFIVRTIEEDLPFSNLGDVPYTYPSLGVILQDHIIHRINGARSDVFDGVRIRANLNDEVYNQIRSQMKYLGRMRNGLNPITGVVSYDWYNAWEQMSAGDDRDAFDSERLASLQAISTISSTAVLGANNNKVTHVRRLMQSVGAA
jgi:hypothetical protein